MNSRARLIVVLALVVVALAAAWAWRRHAIAVAHADGFDTEPLARGELTQSVSANGTLNPVTLVNVGTQVSGTVSRLYVDYNSRVEKGQVLLTLDDSLYSAQSRQSAANVRAATANLELARANEERMRGLFAREYVSKQDLDTAVTSASAAAAQLQLAQAQSDKDRVNLAYTTIRSPVSGVVVDRLVDVGQTVAASFQTPTLIKIAQDLTKMQIDSSFAEADVGNIRVGQAVRFSVDAFPSRQFRGEVRQIRLNPTTVQNVVTYDVVVGVDNSDQILLPGMTAYVSIEVAHRQNALLVPNAALRFHPPGQPTAAAARRTGGGRGGEQRARTGDETHRPATVYVLENGKPQAVRIRAGITDGRSTELAGGPLKAGDSVIIGFKVDTMPSGAAPSGGMRFRVM